MGRRRDRSTADARHIGLGAGCQPERAHPAGAALRPVSDVAVLKSLLIANRGEIARRVIRTARRMGIRTIAVYSDADANMPFVREADASMHIGPAPARESYLDQRKILE